MSCTTRSRLWVPSTTSTQGARSRTSSRSFWAAHPPTTSSRPARASLNLLSWPRFPYRRLSAFSRMVQVLTKTTSASSALAALTMPSASNNPATRSLSCSFIWQPKVRRK